MLVKLLRNGLGQLFVFANQLTLPKPKQRKSLEQEKVNLECQSLSLYQFYACPFCVKTRRAIHRLNLPIQYRNASISPYRDELEKQAGKIQVPCLRIEEQGNVKWLYESDDVIEYLESRF